MSVVREKLAYDFYAVKTDSRYSAYPHFAIEVSNNNFNNSWELLQNCKKHLLVSDMQYVTLPLNKHWRVDISKYPLAVKWNRTPTGVKIYFKNREDLDAMLLIMAMNQG